MHVLRGDVASSPPSHPRQIYKACDEVAVFADPLGTYTFPASIPRSMPALPGKLRPKSVDQLSEVDCGQKTKRLRRQTTFHETTNYTALIV